MPQSAQNPFLTTPLTYSTLEQWLAHLRYAYPGVRISTLAYSVFGRRIPYLLLGEGKTAVLYVAAHHAMEWIGGNLLLHFAEELLERGKQKDKIVKDLFSRFRLVIVPQLNPDGVTLVLEGGDPNHPYYHRQLRMNGESEDFSHWQANARGVDLNHNYSVGFAEYQTVQRELGIYGGAPSLYSGLRPESEPETAALAGLVRLLHPRLILTLHTQGEEIYFDAPNASPAMHKIAQRLAALTGYTLGIAEGTAAYGGLTEWAVRCGIPSFTLECGKGKNPLPIAFAPEIYETLQDAFLCAPSLAFC